MKTYRVKRDFSHDGAVRKAGELVGLSARQARYLLINGVIEDAEAAPVRKAGRKNTGKAARKKQPQNNRRTGKGGAVHSGSTEDGDVTEGMGGTGKKGG